MSEVDDNQPLLFDSPEGWEHLWEGMPEFIQGDQQPDSSLKVHFRSREDREQFLKLTDYPPVNRQSIWFPEPKDKQDFFSNSSAPHVRVPPNRYPVYVISKGRAKTPLTIGALEQLGIPHSVVIEPQEREEYEAAVGPASTIRELPFSNLGRGSIPARNWCWEDARAQGYRRHWILDDNLKGFYRLNRNIKRQIVDSNPFTPMEEFTDRYQNVVIAGPHYQWFIQSRAKTTPFLLNSRVYSCLLIDNSLPFRWRGRYNEDTDLCLRALKAGYCTVLFRAYLIDKAMTMTMAGGNTDELYAGDGRLQMAESLQEQHPDCVTVTTKWGRHQHHVDYSPFRFNELEKAA